MKRLYCGVMIGFLFSAFVIPVYALGPWVRDTVEFRPTSDPMIGFDADMALDGSGYPHIVYNYYGGDTRYAFWDGSSWTIRNISYGAGYGVGIALDALDDVHIAIGCLSDVRYAYSSDGGSSWTLETIEGSWWHCDIDVDNSDVPHLAYCRLNTDFRHAVRLGASSWQTTTIENIGTGNICRAMIHIDETDTIHVVYYPHLASSELKYALSGNGGTSWSVASVAAANPTSSCAMPSFAVRNIVKFIAYEAGGLSYAYTNPGWTTQGLDPAGSSEWTSIAVRGDTIHIFYVAGPNVKYAYSTDNGLNWQIEVVDTFTNYDPAGANIAFWRGGLALDAAGTPHVAYTVNRSNIYLPSWAIYAYRDESVGIQTPAFSAKAESYYIKLEWKFEIENSSLQYLILKKSMREDADYFEIARISGSGSSPSQKTYSYKDEEVLPERRYFYKLGVVKTNGDTEWYGPVSAVVSGTKGYLEVSPNPSRDIVNIEYCTGQSAEDVELKIYDLNGRLVRTFSSSLLSLRSSVTWDGRDTEGKEVPPGVYFVQLRLGNHSLSKKALLLR